jgi:hypothetical protein
MGGLTVLNGQLAGCTHVGEPVDVTAVIVVPAVTIENTAIRLEPAVVLVTVT